MKPDCQMPTASTSPKPSRSATNSSSPPVPGVAPLGDTVMAVTEWLQKALHVTAVLTLCLAAVGVVVAGLASFLYGEPQNKKVVTTTQAGVLRSIALSGGLIPRALVETDAAFYVVETGLSLGKGEALQLQQRASGEHYLCSADGHCARLLMAP